MSRQSRVQSSRRNPKVRADDPEPSIGELLDDPILQILMARDGVRRGELLDIVDAARARLGIGMATPAARRSAFEATLFAECGA
jgi:hypothetical protein